MRGKKLTVARLIGALLLASLLAGCSGAIHALPDISTQDINRATSEITNAPNLEANTRSHDENAQLVQSVAMQLQNAAEPICRREFGQPCSFEVIYANDNDINAYASLPNKITINYGLIRYLGTEDEIAAVLGHEMGHHIADHINKSIENQMIGSTIAGIVFGALAAYSGAYQYDLLGLSRDMENVMQAGGGIGLISYSKEHEREADYIAAYILHSARYDLQRARSVWVTLTKASGDMSTSMFDTHPSGADRLAAWDRSVAEVISSPDGMPNLVGEFEPINLNSLDAPTTASTSIANTDDMNHHMEANSQTD